MRRQLVARQRWWLATLAFAGVVVTHAVSYRVAAHEHVHRTELLHDTGHGIWPPYLAAAALAAIVLALAGSVIGPRAAGASGVRSTAVRLALLQGAGWLAIETGERVAMGEHHLTLASAAPVLIGLAVQVAVALVGALLLSLVAVAVDRLRGRRRHRVERPVHRWVLRSLVAPPLALAAGASSPRGPPLP